MESGSVCQLFDPEKLPQVKGRGVQESPTANQNNMSVFGNDMLILKALQLKFETLQKNLL